MGGGDIWLYQNPGWVVVCGGEAYKIFWSASSRLYNQTKAKITYMQYEVCDCDKK